MRVLSKAEDQVMKILWGKKKAVVNELIEVIPNPKPAYNTISTIVRILEKKGFVSHKAYGKTHEYFPNIQKEEYIKFYLDGLISRYFDGSFSNLVHFFIQEEKLNAQDINRLFETIKTKKKMS